MLDGLAIRVFGMSKAQAMEAGLCIRCKAPVDPRELEVIDQAEYEISACCPKCWGEIMDAWEDEDGA